MSKRAWRQGLCVLLLAALALVAAEAMKPVHRLAELRPEKIALEQMLPAQFAGWQMQAGLNGGIVNPVQEANLRRLYSQTLSRLYIGPAGERVMVSIAYGEDQRKYLALHYPEVCYPAQGFSVKSNSTVLLDLPGQSLPVRRLETFMAPNRPEPVSYWTTMGDYSSFGGLPRRMIELRYGLQRQIPDGLLFRVSTIGADSAREFAIQERFLRELLGSLSPQTRLLFTGRYAP
jgi:EpsI family protein